VFFTVLSDGEAHAAALALVMHVGMSEWGREKMESCEGRFQWDEK
jgi:hypothetical protein